jgi:small-conductance mechanosensitive channel
MKPLTQVEINEKRKSIREKIWFVIKVLLVIAIGYSFANYDEYLKNKEVLNQLLYGLNTFLTASIVISIGRFLLISWYLRRNRKGDRVRGSFVLGINQFSVILHTVFGLLGFMLIVGINPKEFLTSITLVAMAIALLFKDYITNMISGLLIMFSDQLTIGDYIKMGDYQGKIMDITLSNIVVRNEDDDAVLIPNNSAFTMSMINHSLENSRKLTIEFHLPRNQSYRFDALHSHLQDYIKRLGKQIAPESFHLKMIKIEQESVLCKVGLQLNSQSKVKKSEVKNGILQEVIRFEAKL